MPVTLPPGRLRLGTSPSTTGSLPVALEARVERRGVELAAQALGQQLIIAPVRSEGELDGAFTSIVERGAKALLVGSGPLLTSNRGRIVALATRHAIPAIYGLREFVEAGGLMRRRRAIDSAPFSSLATGRASRSWFALTVRSLSYLRERSSFCALFTFSHHPVAAANIQPLLARRRFRCLSRQDHYRWYSENSCGICQSSECKYCQNCRNCGGVFQFP
jgi:hypothetical protein